MPRFFFDVYEGPKLVRDNDGLELPSLEVAKIEAHTTLSEMLNHAPYGERGNALKMAVRDDGGVRVIVSLQTRVFER